MSNFTTFIIVAVIVAGAVLAYFYQDAIFARLLVNYEKGIREETRVKLEKECEEQKVEMELAAQKILDETVAEKDKVIEETRTELQAQIDSGKMSGTEAESAFQTKLSEEQAKLETVKAELQAQIDAKDVALKDAQLSAEQLKAELNAPKKECKSLVDQRLHGGSYVVGTEEDDKTGEYGAVKDFDECRKACENNPDCKQYVWWKPASMCFPMNKQYDGKDEGVADFISGHCE